MSFSSNLFQSLSWVTFITHLFSHWVVSVSCFAIVRPINIQHVLNLQRMPVLVHLPAFFPAARQSNLQLKIPPSSNCEKNNVVINIH